MKTATRITIILIALISLFVLTAANPLQGARCGPVVFGGICTLEEGEVLGNSLVVMGGRATLEAGSRVGGDVVVMGGAIDADGEIKGDLIILGGAVNLGESAVVAGNVATIGGSLRSDEGAVVEGEQIDITTAFPLLFSGDFRVPGFETDMPLIIPGVGSGPQWDWQFNPLLEAMMVLFKAVLWALLAVIVVLFVPRNTESTAGAAISQPLASGGLGCVTLPVAILILVGLAITICGIPLTIVGTFLLAAAWAFGLISLGTEVGKRLAGLLKLDWALPVSAGVGTFVLTFVTNATSSFMPCVGWLVPLLVGVVGLGAVLLTRFGRQDYPPYSPSSPPDVSQLPHPPTPPADPSPGVPFPEVEQPMSVDAPSESVDSEPSGDASGTESE